ncbi:MAG TPA: hypothetical protein VIG52_01290 [Methyloceanibacter sp.]
MERSVNVWGRPCVVQVDQKSQTVWVVTGEYLGKTISVKDRTASSAVRLWVETATRPTAARTGEN